eukprot:TRINITY_DN91697_c0_g1_i1.p1 TRINITY_DN91697_c0_g1~~TRINITY_DN91697_c0_g1_i1.p1  ORF type:complete len:403 (+),score=45.26 TRINITY_DN91697_c0_g1_i1:25-1209(+)
MCIRSIHADAMLAAFLASLGRQCRCCFVAAALLGSRTTASDDGKAPFSDQPTVEFLPLHPVRIADGWDVLLGRETEASGKPFYILPKAAPSDLLAEALTSALQDLTYGDHKDEADWRPAYEIYIMEKGAPLQGVAPEPFVKLIDHAKESVMPLVRQVYECPSCIACTAFVRRFFPAERSGVPAHFDVTSYATIVIPLSPATNYTGGFYVQPDAHIDSRRYVPLETGDITLYDYTLNHGVEVLEGGRYVLAIWVSSDQAACDASKTPWHADRAQQGDAVAQHILGMMYGQGNGAPQDDEKALYWTWLSAEGGLVNAQSSLATMYFEGMGAPENKTEAFHWYQRAALAGDASSQMIISRMYMEGLGTEQNDNLAAHWYHRSMSQKGATLMGPPSWS